MSLDVIDTFIGLVSVFLILSLIVTAIGQGISEAFNFKGQITGRIIDNLLGNELAVSFFKHANIKRLAGHRKSLPVTLYLSAYRFVARLGHGKESDVDELEKELRQPSYIAPEIFSETLLDLLLNPGGSNPQATPVPGQIERLLVSAPVASSPLPAGVYRQLQQMWQKSACDVTRFQGELCSWFDNTAHRSYGWYRRKMAGWLFAVGFVLALLLNADTIQMFRELSSNSELRQLYAAKAIELVEQNSAENKDAGAVAETLCQKLTRMNGTVAQPDEQKGEEKGVEKGAEPSAQPDCSADKLLKHALPEILPLIGWDGARVYPDGPSFWSLPDSPAWFKAWFLKIVGFLLTAVAVSLGAPFWFELLNKIIRIRGAIATSTGSASNAGDKTAAAETPAAAVAKAPLAKTTLARVAATDEALQNISHFEDKRLGYSALNLFWSARLSLMAYADSVEVEAALAQIEASGVLLQDTTGNTDTQCIVLRSANVAVVSFRGTENNLQDWMTNKQVELVAPGWDSKDHFMVHKGFNESLDSVWSQLMQFLEEEGVFRTGLPIWLCGHSLGGALAALAALRLGDEIRKAEGVCMIGGLYTFGQPRVGDSDCAKTLDKRLANRYFRMINHRDVVTRVPLTKTPDLEKKIREKGEDWQVYDYVHGGRVIYFNEMGRAIIDPPGWYQKLDALPVATDFATLRGAIAEAVGDHSMRGYLALQQSLLAVSDR